MDCKTGLSLLEAYLDNELDRADARELEAHIDTCADCGAALSRLDELRQSLRDRALHYAAPQSLRDRIQATANAHVVTPRWSMPAWTRPAAACVLAFGAGGISVHLLNSGQSTGGPEQIARDLFASHWRALAATSPVDVISTDRHTVKPWFAGKVAQAPLVQDFAEQGFALAGGRIDYVGSTRVPVLVYRHGQHIIDVFVLPQEGALPRTAQDKGYALSAITLGDQPAAIVSDMDAAERARFAELLAAKR